MREFYLFTFITAPAFRGSADDCDSPPPPPLLTPFPQQSSSAFPVAPGRPGHESTPFDCYLDLAHNTQTLTTAPALAFSIDRLRSPHI